MFNKGATVYYATAGVCKVNDICRSPFNQSDERMYYVLQPNDSNNGTIIYAPVENETVVLRPLMTKCEATELISSLSDLPLLDIINEKQRRDEYRNAMKLGTPKSLAMVIKTVYNRKKNAVNEKKRFSDTDSEFDKAARHCLFGELSCVLDITSDEAEARVFAAIEC